MSILQQLTAFGTAVFLSASAPQYQVDLKTTSPNGVQRIDPLWMIIFIDDAGREIVVQAKLTTGDYAPMIAADTARLESMMTAARELAKASNKTMRLVKFTNRVDVEEIRP
jgi:hypothetical protein